MRAVSEASTENRHVNGARPALPGIGPTSKGLLVALAWLVFALLSHALATVVEGPAPLPFGFTRFAWTLLVDSALLGLFVAGVAALKHGAIEDLRHLAPMLPSDAVSREECTRPLLTFPRTSRIVATIIGALGGLGVATLDPALRTLHVDLAFYDPRYVAFVIQNALFGALFARLVELESRMTHGYAVLGQLVEVDLLDVSRALVFGRKGLRSAMLWGSISAVFSMFWVLESAGQSNVGFAILVLGLASTAVVAPTNGFRRNIAKAKEAELEIVSEVIRRERNCALAPRAPGTPSVDARLGNLIQYQAFVRSIREWPFDLSTVARSALFILLGAGLLVRRCHRRDVARPIARLAQLVRPNDP